MPATLSRPARPRPRFLTLPRLLPRFLPGIAVLVFFISLAQAQPGQTPQAGGQARPPQKPKNLKVLPKDISHDELIRTMRTFAQGLGVRCTYCHVGEEGKPPDTYDFASDQKQTKQSARLMIRMTRDLNAKWISKVKSDRPSRQVVGCVTCHHGQPVPMTMEQALTAALAQGGVTAAVQKYRDLREKYFGRDTYDFSERPLDELARTLTAENRIDDATALLNLNAEFYPQSATIQVLLGEAQLKAGDKTRAADFFRKALEFDPNNDQAKKHLAEMGGS